MGSGVGSRGSDVTARPRAPMSASRAGAQVRGEARGQEAGAKRRDCAARGSAAGFPGGGMASPTERRGLGQGWRQGRAATDALLGPEVWTPRRGWAARV